MIAIIPARGGSKGLPNKNIKLLSNKPLIAYSIQESLIAKQVDKVFVTTDSESIAKIAQEYGAECPFLRPKHLASDDSPAIDTYLYMIERIESILNKKLDSIVVLLPTSPLKSAYDIDQAISLFKNKNADSVVSYTELSHPIQWCKYLDNEGRVIDIFENSIDNRQKLQNVYLPNGAIYVFKVELLKKRKYYSHNSYAYLMPQSRSVDIDSELDFRWAEFLLQNDKK